MSFRMSKRENKAMNAACRRFIKANPPRMPKSFTHSEWKRITSYAYIAFCTGYRTARHDVTEVIDL